MPLEDKVCSVCGRRITWRKKWARDWDAITRCSQRCRRRRLDETDRALEEAIVSLARTRGRGKTLCPSEAARTVAPDDWRPLMERTRQAARRLVAREVVDILQKGAIVDPSSARGPIRIRLR